MRNDGRPDAKFGLSVLTATLLMLPIAAPVLGQVATVVAHDNASSTGLPAKALKGRKYDPPARSALIPAPFSKNCPDVKAVNVTKEMRDRNDPKDRHKLAAAAVLEERRLFGISCLSRPK